VDGGNIVRGTFGTLGAPGRQHNDPAVFKQAQEAIAVFDLAQRAEAYNKFYRVIRDEVFEIGLGYQNIPFGAAPRVKEWTPWPLSFWPSGLHTIVLK
jgi:ABC-type transport system substrate-binding protein